MRWFLWRKGYSPISVHFGGWGAKNTNLVSGAESACISFHTLWAKILHLPTISTAGKLACSLYLQNLCDGEGGKGVSLAFIKQITYTLRYTTGQRETSAFWPGFGSYQAALFYFYSVCVSGWHQVKRSKENTWEILWYTHSCASIGKKLPEASPSL